MLLPPLTDGIIHRRYKRFLADVELQDGALVTAHCPNTGAMTGCWEPGALAQLSHSDNPKRKLAWTLERVDMGQGWVGVNTMRTNGVVAEAIEAGKLPALAGFGVLRREVRLDLHGCTASRLDIHLSDGKGRDAFVEVKNVTLWDGERLRFPDAPSARGRKHLEVLREAVCQGYRGVILFALNRPEGECFSPAHDVDPAYSRLLKEVQQQGVEVLAVRICHTLDGMFAGGMVNVDLKEC